MRLFAWHVAYFYILLEEKKQQKIVGYIKTKRYKSTTKIDYSVAVVEVDVGSWRRHKRMQGTRKRVRGCSHVNNKLIKMATNSINNSNITRTARI